MKKSIIGIKGLEISSLSGALLYKYQSFSIVSFFLCYLPNLSTDSYLVTIPWKRLVCWSQHRVWLKKYKYCWKCQQYRHGYLYRAQEKVHIFIYKMSFSTPNPLFDHFYRIVSSKRFKQSVKYRIWWRNYHITQVDRTSFYASYLELCYLGLCCSSTVWWKINSQGWWDYGKRFLLNHLINSIIR